MALQNPRRTSATWDQRTYEVLSAVLNEGETALGVTNPALTGTWGYQSGTSGTVNIGASVRVAMITAAAGSGGGSFTINGGSSVTIPANSSITISPRGILVAPTLVFTSTSAYFVETVE